MMKLSAYNFVGRCWQDRCKKTKHFFRSADMENYILKPLSYCVVLVGWWDGGMVGVLCYNTGGLRL